MNEKAMCPECGKELEIMYAEHIEDKVFSCIFSCEKCVDGLPIDWDAKYSPKHGYTNFERHFWGQESNIMNAKE